MRTTDVVIVGAGVVGCAIAYALSRLTTLRIIVCERGTPGCEASNAAAGVLAVASGRARRGVLLELRRISAGLFPALVAELEEETGIAMGYRRAGLLSLAFSVEEAEALQDLVRHRRTQAMHCEMLERSEVLDREAAVHPQLCAAALFPDECSIDSGRLVTALVEAARNRGVEFRVRTAVRSLQGGRGTIRLAMNDESIEATTAIVAAGAWCGEVLSGCGIKVPLRPARGEMAALRPVAWQLRHMLAAGDTYLVPCGSGEVLLGSTTAFVGFDKRVSQAGLAALRLAAEQMVPQIAAAPLLRAWAGLRPCSTIRRPIIAPLPGLENVILATGHHRSGILLAPVTAQLVAEMITERAPTVPLRPFSFRRH